jgi:hypothetical protein
MILMILEWWWKTGELTRKSAIIKPDFAKMLPCTRFVHTISVKNYLPNNYLLLLVSVLHIFKRNK